ncbi:MAG: hypothetical protein ACOX5G_13495 [Kiritimatiellia bacterium]|jgi:hypothetical protein
MADEDTTQGESVPFIADRHRNPAELAVRKGNTGDIWAGIVAILAFVVGVATVLCLYLDFSGLTGV